MTKNDYLKEGFKYFAIQDFVAAEKNFTKALELDSEFDLALNALSEVYNKTGELDLALDTVKKLISLTPDDALAHAALSRLYMQKGMISEAEEELAISNRLSAD